MAYVVLGILAGVSFAALGFVLYAATDDGGPAWSAWKPAGSGLERADEIAAYVSARYRLDGATQLVAVKAGQPSYQEVPAAGYAIRQGGAAGDVDIRTADSAIQYELCGLGEGCSIATGQPSAERERLVRREALELALYTFHYLPAVDRVAAFLPPRAGSSPTWVLLFERDAYRQELSEPVSATLPDAVPQPTAIDAGQVALIDRLTEPARFRFEVQSLQNGAPLFVLDPSANLP
jgi:hypothetical protein